MSASDESTHRPVADPERGLYTTERAKAFIDAVVAIAMTLLILPLMEAVADGVGERDLHPGAWFAEHSQPLFTFLLSFALIAMFWVNHHRVYARVTLITLRLLWVNIAWLLMIVWLPVATALIGRSENGEPIAALSYVGTLILASALMLGMRLYLRRHPEMHEGTDDALLQGVAADLAMLITFAASLTVILIFPAVGYIAMFLTFFIGPLQAVFARLLGARGPRRAR